MPISRSHFKKRQIPPFWTLTNVCGFVQICGWFLGILGSGKRHFFLKDMLNWGKYEMLKIWWIWKIEIWSEELKDGHQTVPYQPGALFWGVNCLIVFPTHFSPSNFLWILFQISLQFRCNPQFEETTNISTIGGNVAKCFRGKWNLLKAKRKRVKFQCFK